MRRARKIREKWDFVARTTEAQRRQELSTSPSRASTSRWGRFWMEWIPVNRRTQDFQGWEVLSSPPWEEVFAVSIIFLCRVREPDDDNDERKKRPNIFVCSKWIPLRKRRTSGDVEISCEESLGNAFASRRMWFRNDIVHYYISISLWTWRNFEQTSTCCNNKLHVYKRCIRNR